MRPQPLSGIIIAAAVVLVLLAAALLATFAGMPVQPDVLPIRWNGGLAV